MDRALRQFLAVAEHGSITRAARHLNVTQPTITVNMRKLEEIYGVDLFDRGPKGMTLTEFGSILYDNAHVISRIEERANRMIADRKRNINQTLAIGCGNVWWEVFLRDVIVSLDQSSPYASIHVESGSNLYCMWKLLAGEINLSISHKIERLSPRLYVEYIPLFRARDQFYVHEHHALAGKRCTMKDLEKLDEISVARSDSQLDHIIQSSQENALPETGRRILSANSIICCADMSLYFNAFLRYPEQGEKLLKRLRMVPLQIEDSNSDLQEVGIYIPSETHHDTWFADLVTAIKEKSREFPIG
ncbi:LysR family transcriptional regulator [Loktanella sp. IMCC34160]|uniref:LysR family transcriptional regulator n=1 Tax=Loktanella sp. IMCC34160 TaxID=2510646 RepID=UPI0013ED7301|nr:LysR family transcriptional regulator [Loktanella sp. IMCC34160]